ncbi:hypothetical protein P691DRAFT_768752 [Macrolepiota fuliginosa MF-IS2]|uniref:Uncharacterized protein n=1 Tax=Macrolepiota fuliginosa MF-IS2 TaxID=1400762 RepID=A0A9P5WW11_9AGAR|nr:hypothetical protein P691DRAFT_768752 [Macrolepiota fuliginosa MF-IS2]
MDLASYIGKGDGDSGGGRDDDSNDKLEEAEENQSALYNWEHINVWRATIVFKHFPGHSATQEASEVTTIQIWITSSRGSGISGTLFIKDKCIFIPKKLFSHPASNTIVRRTSDLW